MSGHSHYFDTLNQAQPGRHYPWADDFPKAFRGMSRDELWDLQNRRFLNVVSRAFQIPFYQRLYKEAGAMRGDIASLEDLALLPTFSKQDLMESIARTPPLGDFHGLESTAARPILHTTSGTTGQPQVLLYGPHSREMQNLLLARAYHFQGLTAGDVVHSVYGFGMINGGHYIRETILHWTGALLLPAGTGNETASVQQLQLMQQFGVTVLLGFADYLKKLGELARANGLTPGRDIPVRRIIGHMGQEDRAALSDLWGGAEIFDWYGVGDTGLIAAEGPDHDGLYIMEDAHYVELLDINSAKPVPEGNAGDIVATVLFKDDIYPIIRFNTHDVSRVVTAASGLNLPFRRLQGFLGRSDNMVKIKGINFFPQAVGPLLESETAYGGNFVCYLDRDASGANKVQVAIEISGDADIGGRNHDGIRDAFHTKLRTHLGLSLDIHLVEKGGLAEETGLESRQKPIRLIDRRKSSQ